MVTRVLKEPKATKFNKNIDKPSVICLRETQGPFFWFLFAARLRRKGYGLSARTLQKFLSNFSYSFGNTLYVVPFGIIRGVLRPFTIAWKICARLVKFAFAGKSAGHPPELSE